MIIAILSLIIALFLVGYAASCNAKMDTVKDHWSVSIYAADSKKYNDEWFDPRLSWTLKNKTNYDRLMILANQYLPDWAVFILEHRNKAWDPLTDFWHFQKSKMIVSIVASAVFAFIAGVFIAPSVWGLTAAAGVMYYAGAGAVWNETFNYFYDRKLVQKPFKKKWLWIKSS